MTLYDISPDGPHKRRPWLEITLLAGFLLCILTGLAALGVFWIIRGSAEPENGKRTLEDWVPPGIMPQLALMQLAGDSASALAFQTLAAGELDTPYAITLFDTEMSAAQRTGLLLRLADRAAADNRREDALHLYTLAQAHALLDTRLSSLERSQLQVQVAAGLTALDAGQTGLESAVQAKLLAEQLPDLLPALRSQLFTDLQPVAERLEDDLFSRQIDELARNPFLSPDGQLIESRWESLGEPLPEDPAVAAAAASRQGAARQLAIRLAQGADGGAERDALAAALVLEDNARNDFFQRTLAGPISRQQQFYLVQQRREWLALKARVALGGFGLSLVPVWEAAVPTILQDLATATASVDVVAQGLAEAQETSEEQADLAAESLMWLVLQAELGLYPGAPMEDLSVRLNNALTRLRDQGRIPALAPTYDPKTEPPGFRIPTAGQTGS